MPGQRAVGETHTHGIDTTGSDMDGIGTGLLGHDRILGSEQRFDPALGVLTSIETNNDGET